MQSAAWRCPLQGHEPDRSKLDPARRESLDRVARLTGYRAETCPHEALYRPEVHRAYRVKNHGLGVEADAPVCLLDAVDAIAQGEGELDDYRQANPRRPDPIAVAQALPGPVTSTSQLPQRKIT